MHSGVLLYISYGHMLVTLPFLPAYPCACLISYSNAWYFQGVQQLPMKVFSPSARSGSHPALDSIVHFYSSRVALQYIQETRIQRLRVGQITHERSTQHDFQTTIIIFGISHLSPLQQSHTTSNYQA